MAAKRFSAEWLRAARGSVRTKTTALAVLVVGAALAVGAVVLVAYVQASLERNVRAVARLRARDVGAALKAADDPWRLRLRRQEDVFVQVMTQDGIVLETIGLTDATRPVASVRPGETKIVSGLPVSGHDDDDEPFLVVERAVPTANGDFAVLVGRNLDSVQEGVSIVSGSLVVAVPVLLLVVGATTWRMVGRALAPVEAIRREVAEISTAELHRRVPDPSGDDEIARLARTMNAMLARLEEAQAKQKRLVSDASHELRNPIASIRHHAEVALAHPHGTTVPGLASDVLVEDMRLQRLAEDLLLLARADEHTLKLNARPLDLDDLVLDEARRLKQGTPLRIDTTGVSAGRTLGDRAQLQRVVSNLAENAARHAASAVRFGVRETDGHVVLEVDDDGPGVAPKFRAAVFERFVRLDDARDRDNGGAGLGLAIVAEIVAAHGGEARLGDAPLGGARFEVVLPGAPS